MGFRILWMATLALLCAVHASEGTNVGAKGRITGKGLDFVGQVGVEFIKSRLTNRALPAISGEQSVLFFGTLKYSLSGKIQEVQIPHSAVQFIPGVGIEFAINGATIKIAGDWTLSFWLGTGGSIALTATDVSISTSMWVTSDAAGHFSVRSAGCTATIGATSLKFSGGASWMYNLFTGVVDKLLHRVTSSYLCPTIDKIVLELNELLQSRPVSQQISPYAGIDYALVNPPKITQQYIEGDFKGEFYSVYNPIVPPFAPAPFSLPDESNKMVYIGISEFVANSASYVYYKSGKFNLDLTDSMLPKESPVRLTTDSFKDLIPEIAKRYPHQQMMLEISATKQPMVTCVPGIMELAASAFVQAFAVQANGAKTPLFQLNLDANVAGTIKVEGTKFSASLDLRSLTLSLVHSDVGPFQVSSLQELLAGVLQKVVLPKVNGLLSQVILFPDIDGLSKVHPTISINQGYLLITV